MTQRVRRHLLPPILIALAAAAAAVALAVPARGQTIGATEQALAQASGREQALSGGVAALNQRIGKLGNDIFALARRGSALEADLNAQQAALAQTRAQLAAERRRLARLERRLRRDRRTLAGRLVAMYESGRPGLVDVIFQAHGFADLLDRADFLKRIGQQDRAVIEAVRRTRAEAAQTAARLRSLRSQRERAVARIASERAQVARTRAAFEAQRASYTRSRARLSAQLAQAGAQRASLEGQLTALRQAAAERAAAQQQTAPSSTPAPTSSAPISGNWAIPKSIVTCESGGQNLSPNSAGASGYYQIMPGTWKLYGGSGSAAYLAPKSEQDKVAAKIYAGGSGASNWVCAGG